jgi:serine/threonine protein kinase
MSLTPGQIIQDRYRVVRLLGPGGMSANYEAVDTVLNVRCFLKEMVPYPGTFGDGLAQLREQFQQEARLLAELRHPNLPRVTDHFDDDGNVYLVMDFIQGQRLDQIIAHGEQISDDKVLEWTRQLMEALAYCHTQGVIHRDVKPQNVIITSQGQAILVDFGLAKLVDPDNPRTRTVMRGLGTPEYAPPEQYDTKQGYTDPRTDVYSLGATLYHALVGEPPPALSERVVNPASLIPIRQRKADVSRAIDRAVMKAMSLQPSRRFQSIAEMHQALFGSPLPKETVASVSPSKADVVLSTVSPKTTILLPWIGGAKGLRVDYRLGATVVVLSLVSLVLFISSLGSRINADGLLVFATTTTPTVVIATPTPTATPSSTAPPPTYTPTSTPTPTATPSPSAEPSFAATPATVMPMWPANYLMQTQESFDPYQTRPSATSSLTPTQTSVPIPTFTPTPTVTPTNTPQPPRPNRPRPTQTSVPTVPPPTRHTPTEEPTENPPVTDTPTTRPTPNPETSNVSTLLHTLVLPPTPVSPSLTLEP